MGVAFSNSAKIYDISQINGKENIVNPANRSISLKTIKAM